MYEFFEDIVCINLDISEDRRKQAQYYFKHLNIPGRFYTVQKHVNGGRYGCFDSHIQIIKSAYERGLNNVLVFEDDFIPTPAFTEERIIEAIQFMRTTDDWDIFYFGYGCMKMDNKEWRMSSIIGARAQTMNIVQYNPYLTQCLCYSRRAMRKLLQEYHKYIDEYHIDVCIASYMDFKNYCMVPMLFDQNFAMDYNIEPQNIVEKYIRTLYPLYASFALNYRISALKYTMNVLFFDYDSTYIYLLTIIISLCILVYVYWCIYIGV
jgi:GR25 family glycosyltransferase involved in LPS biosynthesis